MNWTAFPFSLGALAAALALIPGAFFMIGCVENTNLTGSTGSTGGAGAGGVGGAGGAEPAICGDGKVGPGEACDDGNTLDGDTCPGVCFHAANDLVLGGSSTCALLLDGRLKCWGLNAEGEL